MTDADVEPLWRLWTMPDVRRYLWDDAVIDRARAAEAVAEARQLADRGLGLWYLQDWQDDAPQFGCAGLFPVTVAAAFDPRLAGGVEPVVALSPARWGRGLATEAVGVLAAYAFDSLGLEELVAVVDVPNVASRRLLERAGFEYRGESPGPKCRLRSYVLTRRTIRH